MVLIVQPFPAPKLFGLHELAGQSRAVVIVGMRRGGACAEDAWPGLPSCQSMSPRHHGSAEESRGARGAAARTSLLWVPAEQAFAVREY